MNAVIVNYRRGRNTQNNNQVLLELESTERKEVAGLIGKKCVYTTITGKKLSGKIMAFHGNKTTLRAGFEKPLPPEAIGKTLEIKE
ncbi:MAG: 50S ribosomal protein L35ae [Candidatus Diapherotrites archaeon]|nr:50S ribosomal protein L35ae [Candidatus Diapherotrites archaeon]